MKPKMRRLFLKWLDTNRPRFAISITVTKLTKGCVDISFGGINPMISARAREQGRWRSLSVFVLKKNHAGGCLDFLMDLDCKAVKKDGGYFCSSCETEKQERFSDLKSLLEDHLFEPFLEWVNGKLATAHWLGIWESEGGSCDAKLIKPKPDPRDVDYALFPLREE